MKNSSKNTLVIGLGLAFVAVAGLLFYANMLKDSTSDRVVRIGAIIFSTGPQAALGQEILTGLTIALEEINTNGGIEGRKVDLILEDSKDNPKEAITEFQKLNSLGVAAVICTGDVVTYTLAPMVGKAKVPFMAVAAAGTEIPLLSDYAFRVWEPEHMMARAIARYAREKTPARKIAILAINNEYGDVSSKCFSDEFSKEGRGTKVEKYNISDTNMRNQIAKCLQMSPDAFFVTGFGDGFGVCINQIRESGFKGLIFTNSGMSIKYFQGQTFNAHEGVIFPTTPFTYGAKNSKVNQFCDAFKAKSGMDASYAAAFGYESLKLIAKAARIGGINRVGIKEGLSHMGNTQSLLGDISYDSNGEIQIPVVIMKMENHIPVLVSESN